MVLMHQTSQSAFAKGGLFCYSYCNLSVIPRFTWYRFLYRMWILNKWKYNSMLVYGLYVEEQTLRYAAQISD